MPNSPTSVGTKYEVPALLLHSSYDDRIFAKDTAFRLAADGHDSTLGTLEALAETLDAHIRFIVERGENGAAFVTEKLAVQPSAAVMRLLGKYKKKYDQDPPTVCGSAGDVTVTAYDLTRRGITSP